MNGFRIARFFGFEVDVDPSWLIVFLLVLWTFTEAIFPARVPGLAPGIYALMALVGAALFFGSVLLHELAHSAMARARGVTVEGITLFIFGGMARMRSEASGPKDEFLITIVGPISSALIGCTLLAAGWAARVAGLPRAVSSVADYLAWLNFVLAVFNLVPGFPLDGGRLLRSVIWHFSGDLRKATRWASLTGRLFGFVLIGLGLLYLFDSLVSGLWFILIGWFLARAAAASYGQIVLRGELAAATAAQVARPLGATSPLGMAADDGPDAAVGPQATLADVIAKLQEENADRVVVIEGGRPVGVITRADIIAWLRDRRGTD
jgi:Zn-dependent protease